MSSQVHETSSEHDAKEGGKSVERPEVTMKIYADAQRLLMVAGGWNDAEATFALNDGGGIIISVAEEKAVDSYNETFTCSISTTLAEAVILYEWLGATIRAMK